VLSLPKLHKDFAFQAFSWPSSLPLSVCFFFVLSLPKLPIIYLSEDFAFQVSNSSLSSSPLLMCLFVCLFVCLFFVLSLPKLPEDFAFQVRWLHLRRLLLLLCLFVSFFILVLSLPKLHGNFSFQYRSPLRRCFLLLCLVVPSLGVFLIWRFNLM
ncbi:MAG: hypothetical protein KAH03_07745, partial [Cocleimonas sp.]|nr:hypothetical protein [Cocleimonas sp.]